MAASLKYVLHYYGSQSLLQRLGVWRVDPARKGKYWVVYIHGGAWRDPRVTHESFMPSIDWILKTSPAATDNVGDNSRDSTSNAIAGFASIDYRLSPHPQFPQDPAKTPPDQYRGARHPDHIDDVRSALVFLQRTYGFGGDYVLVGHSAGAALAFQLLTTSSPSATATEHPVPPAAIVGFEGLYDFTAVDARYGGAYATFLRGAFGDDPENWDAAAPIKFTGNYAENWPGGKFILLGWSPDDTLVDEPEADNMARRLRDVDGFVNEGQGGELGEKTLLLLKDVRGDHDEIWRSGEHVSRMVWIALRTLGTEL
ncbi:alpha/beta-hydrolase [Xylaria bambusicola]|uniref:alpha/beta-hydrolase n=1 Tax=Xylaria bambusicola TaxID=326684 RepID=UPI0020086B82|nr:alpha/beta-hydrolase [Xylaria bambusicola]KAI0525673.1 alpha/beta-hydrolase [Xylaria bambusicola]